MKINIYLLEYIFEKKLLFFKVVLKFIFHVL